MNNTRIAIAVTAASALGLTSDPVTAQPVLPGIIHWWSGDGDATDSVGDADGTIIDLVVFTEGRFGQAFDFNEGWIEFGTTAGNFGTSDFTIAFWVRTSIQDATGLIDKRPECGCTNMIDIRMLPKYGWGTDTWISEEGCAGIGGAFGNSPINDGAWRHVVVRREGTALSVFFDGSLDDTGKSPFVVGISNTAPLQAGRSACTGQFGNMPFVGQLDEIQLYGRALTDEEVLTLAGNQACLGDVDQDGIVGVTDMLVLLAFWGPCGSVCLGDLDFDGTIGVVDFLTLLSLWGPCG